MDLFSKSKSRLNDRTPSTVASLDSLELSLLGQKNVLNGLPTHHAKKIHFSNSRHSDIEYRNHPKTRSSSASEYHYWDPLEDLLWKALSEKRKHLKSVRRHVSEDRYRPLSKDYHRYAIEDRYQ